jgi:hypothetical protein
MFEKSLPDTDSYPTGIAIGWLLFLFLASLFVVTPVLASTKDLASELISFVQEAAELIEKEGEAAFPKFRDPGGM